MATPIEGFNRHLRTLVRQVGERCSGDATVHRVRQRVMTALSLSPTEGVERVGPYLWTYRDQLSLAGEARDAYFLGDGLAADLRAAGPDEASNPAGYIVARLRDLFRLGMKREEREEYYEMLAEMLDFYVDYLEEKK